ncbi:MAG: carboxypeptidase regulatory-like domain-containing protein [Candidatus Thermoplasmatota archaeon]|nr:carboxypeptidase regulatory-like domain-containing protein [Candidatus Thermoplasmatota archaeon]
MARRARSSRTRGAKAGKKESRATVVKGKGISTDADASQKGTKEKGAAKREEPERSTLRDWYNANKYTIFILTGIFILAILLREYFYYQISFNTWPPNIVGNDPSYHKRVIDVIQTDNRHIFIDPLLNYPISGGNPRPPLFDWSIAVFGIVLSPFFGFNVENSTWFVYEFAPTFWGALTIFPMYLLGKQVFGKKTGIMAALLLALMASHIERSTLGFTDHDSFVVFFVVLTMYFLSRSFSVQRDRDYISDWRRPDSVILGFRSFIRDNRQALQYAFLTGLSISAIALAWQGYAYVLAIILIYYLVQLLIHRFRNEDPMGTYAVVFISMGTVVLLSLPYYFVSSHAVWSQGFYILLASVVLGIFIVPTRDIPWLLVIPTLGLFIVASYFIMQWGFPDTADLLFTGGGYFATNKLYSTIAEAQPPDISRLFTTYGPATFFLGLVGVVMAVLKIPKQMKKDYIVIVVWALVAVYMAFSAIRFNFNATPAFALLAGWVVIRVSDKFKADGLSIVYSIVALLVLIGGLIVLSEGYDGFIGRNYVLLTMVPIVLGSLVYFGFMKYKRKRDYFQFRKILTALGVGFIVILPNAFYAVDAAIPIESKSDFDPELEYLGSFGSSLHSEYWMDSYKWLAQQDIMDGNDTVAPEDRPAFMSWWDYGFDQLLLGKHPTAADNFQNGYHFTGSMIASQSESEAVALMITRLLEGDWKKGSFSREIWDVLVEHLGDDKNSTESACEILRIFKRPGTYMEEVENDPGTYGTYVDITRPNAKYAAARVVLTHLDEEELVNLYHDVRGVSGDSLRYFAVDYRLFPFSAQNTGIFYAPITLADRDVEDYLEYKVYAQENTRGSNDDPQWADYPDNPITMEKAREESDRLGYKFRILDTDMYYTDMFYNSLFYRTYVGVQPVDLGSPNDGKSVPGMLGDLQSVPAMQGWNMTHWKLVYRTMYYSEKEDGNASFPDDYSPMSSKKAVDLYRDQGGDVKSGLGQGAFYIMYYDGAIVSGNVRTERGVGVPDVRVTVLDDYGIPHGNVITGPNGEYSLIVPPGDVQIVVTDGPLDTQYDKLYQFQVDQSTGQPRSLLNNTRLTISDELAMREVDDGEMSVDLVVPGMTISGKIYWDLDEDSVYTDGTDELIGSGELVYELVGSEGKVYGPDDLSEDGEYSFSDLVTGTYKIRYINGGQEEVLIDNYKVELQEDSTKDIRMDNARVQGMVFLDNGMPLPNQTVHLSTAAGDEFEFTTDISGNYSIDRLFPGIYTLSVDTEGFYHEAVKLPIVQGDNLTQNVTLYPEGSIELKVHYPFGSGVESGQANSNVYSGKPARGAVVHLSSRDRVGMDISLFLDEKGELSSSVPIGIYDLYIYSVERETNWAYIDTVKIMWKETFKDAVELSSAFKINGTLLKHAGLPMNSTEIMFERISDSARVPISSNIIGGYLGYLPRADYMVIVMNTTQPANVTYITIQELKAPPNNDNVELDIFAAKTAIVNGRIFWDRDGDNEYTSYENIAPGDLSDIPLENVQVTFQYSNGTLAALSDSDGMYSIDLPPMVYQMIVEVNGFYHFAREVDVENSAAVMNFGLNDTDAQLEAKGRQMQLNISRVFYGESGIDETPASGMRITVTPMENADPNKVKNYIIDGDGIVTFTALPGEYNMEIMKEEELDGMLHVQILNHQEFIEPDDDTYYADLIVEHKVIYKGNMFYMENSIMKYPPEMVVNFNAIMGERVTIAWDDTNFNGEFEVELPAGDFILSAELERPGTHYMYWDMVSVGFGSEIGNFEMVQSLPVEGDVSPVFDDIKDSELFFEKDGLWKSAGLDGAGHFFAVLFMDTYDVDYRFMTIDSSLGTDIEVEYYLEEQIEVDGAIVGADLTLSKNVMIKGAVYDDMNKDRTIDPEERLSGVNVTFTPMDTVFDPVSVISDENGDYSVFVPFTRLRVSVDADGYNSEPREDTVIFDLPRDGYAMFDVPLVPDNIVVDGMIYFDEDGSGEMEYGEKSISDMVFEFKSDDGETVTTTTGGGGTFHVELPPGIYDVVGFRYSDGRPDRGYLSVLNLDLGDELIDQKWPGVSAERVSGTVFYRDTDSVVHFTPPSDEPITFTVSDSGSKLEVRHDGGTYQIDLPHYEYYVSSTFAVEEYGQDMTYRVSETITVNESSTAENFALEFEKRKLYTFESDLVKDFQHEMEMAPTETVRLEYFLENTGNEPFSLTMGVQEKPDGWVVEFPDGEDVHLEIGQSVTRIMNVTAPAEPDFTNSLILEGETDQGTKDTFQVQIDTPANYRFDLELDIPDVLGVAYDETRVFNLTVLNRGNGEDVVNIQMDTMSNHLPDWKVEWEGSPDFPVYGENASLTPNGVRKYAVTVFTPEGGNSSLFNEQIVIRFTGENRRGDIVTKDVRIEVRKPNLVLPSNFLKLANRRLDDPTLNKTVEANITIKALYRDVSNVNVSLKIDGEIVAYGYIVHIPQGGIGHTKLRFNTTDNNISEDEFHTFEVEIDPGREIVETDPLDNVGVWKNVVIGQTPTGETEVNWRIVVFLILVLLVAVGVIAYRERSQPV